MSELVDGRIPPYTECPYWRKCEIASDGACHHTGDAHPVAFSCALARGFAIIERHERRAALAREDASK